MSALARADLESLLRARKLDRTLTSTRPLGDATDDHVAATGLEPLDARLGGGFPRGHLSEIAGPATSGRATLAVAALAAATRRGELVAIVDALDRLDVVSAAGAGIDLDRLLWIRGFVVPNPGRCRDLNHRALDQALRALTLVLQAGNFGVVVLDVAGAPADALQRLPYTTWLRLQRMVEGTQTACLLVGDKPMARSRAGMTVVTSPRAQGARRGSQLFAGIDIDARVVQARPDPVRIPNPESRIPSHVRLHLQAAV